MNVQSLSPVRSNAGFTIIEVLVVVALISVMLTLAAPGFGSLMATTRIKGAASNLHLSLLRARSEAVKRNLTVTMQRTGGSNWHEAGWIVQDSNNVLLDTQGAQAGVTITSKPGCGSAASISSIAYQRFGRVTGLTNANRPCFEVSATGTTQKRCVAVEISGMPSVRSAAC